MTSWMLPGLRPVTIDLEITRVDLDELVRDVMGMMRIPCHQKALELSSEWSGTSDRIVRMDGPKLRQILLNLIGNAIKYTNAGSIILRVDVARMDHAGKFRLSIEVQDTGIGITAEEQLHIFDPFVQLGHGHSRKGSGLGLAICRQSAQMMGGTIQVKSAPGAGSTFRVELPVETEMESQVRDAGEIGVDADQPQVRSTRSTPATNPATLDGAESLAGVAALGEALRSELLSAVLLLDKDHILDVIGSVSAVDPELGIELTRLADALEFTPIMRAILAGEED